MEDVKETKKIGKGKAGPGRPKGLPNKTTQAAKDAIALAAEALGGTDRLVEWVREHPDNEKAFWVSIYPKLLPLQVNGGLELSGGVEFKQIIVQGVTPKNV